MDFHVYQAFAYVFLPSKSDCALQYEQLSILVDTLIRSIYFRKIILHKIFGEPKQIGMFLKYRLRNLDEKLWQKDQNVHVL